MLLAHRTIVVASFELIYLLYYLVLIGLRAENLYSIFVFVFLFFLNQSLLLVILYVYLWVHRKTLTNEKYLKKELVTKPRNTVGSSNCL